MVHKGGFQFSDVQRVIETETTTTTTTAAAAACGGGLVQQLVTESVENKQNKSHNFFHQ